MGLLDRIKQARFQRARARATRALALTEERKRRLKQLKVEKAALQAREAIRREKKALRRLRFKPVSDSIGSLKQTKRGLSHFSKKLEQRLKKVSSGRSNRLQTSSVFDLEREDLERQFGTKKP